MECKLIMTAKDMENRDNWLHTRKMGIGGSDAAVIMGLSHWKTPARLWMEKTGRVEPDDISDSEVVYWGTVLESVVADEFAKRTGKKVKKSGMYRSIKYPWMLASVDRMVIGERAGLECKTTTEFNKNTWNDNQGLGIPIAYYCQIQWYMTVLGYPKWYIACLIGGQTYVWKEIPRDDVFIGELIMLSEKFWKCIKEDVCPEPDCSSDYGDLLRLEYGYTPKSVTRLDECLPNIERLEKLKSDRDFIDGEITLEENKIKSAMKDFQIADVGPYRVKWTDTNRKYKDSDRVIRKFSYSKI